MKIRLIGAAVALAALTIGAVLTSADAGQPPLSVSISGPTDVAMNDVCTWNSVVSGGTPPYTYQWGRIGGGGSSTDEDFTLNTGTSDFYIALFVTDAANTTLGSGKFFIDVEPFNDPC